MQLGQQFQQQAQPPLDTLEKLEEQGHHQGNFNQRGLQSSHQSQEKQALEKGKQGGNPENNSNQPRLQAAAQPLDPFSKPAQPPLAWQQT
mmetsp:Transcript_5435/g.9165  ORF Transcript_5435/g.9165 Transcript_5435/m.9165 type:complete len:90 (-) Transcript_5435:439-708(-)